MGGSANVSTRIDACTLETAKEFTSVYIYLYSMFVYHIFITSSLWLVVGHQSL